MATVSSDRDGAAFQLVIVEFGIRSDLHGQGSGALKHYGCGARLHISGMLACCLFDPILNSPGLLG
jgi:hypothetical protein